MATRYGFADTWGAEHGFRFFGDKHWAEPLKWAKRLPESLGRRPRVFCASMADVFEDRPELVEPRAKLFDLIYRTLELDWLILTKRPENVGRMLGPEGVGLYAVDDRPVAFPQPNVWVGTSIENSRFTWRADVLRQVPAAVRFISAEPLLASLYEGVPPPEQEWTTAKVGTDRYKKWLDLTGIDWVIVGGESGPGARPTHLEHVREIVEACRAEGVAPFVKQLGAKPVYADDLTIGAPVDTPLALRDRKGGDWDEWPDGDLHVREFPTSHRRSDHVQAG